MSEGSQDSSQTPESLENLFQNQLSMKNEPCFGVELERKNLFFALYKIILSYENHEIRFDVFIEKYRQFYDCEFFADLKRAEFTSIFAVADHFPNSFIAERKSGGDVLTLYIANQSKIAGLFAQNLKAKENVETNEQKSDQNVQKADQNVQKAEQKVQKPNQNMQKADKTQIPPNVVSQTSQEKQVQQENEIKAVVPQGIKTLANVLNKQSATRLLTRIVEKNQGISLDSLRYEFEDAIDQCLDFKNAEEIFGFKPTSFVHIISSLPYLQISTVDGSEIVQLSEDYMPTK